ncbi:MAG: hypothetical protein JOZ41_15145 [Chloroflexi bacterium]|nr:hypothetical protein [Chloroflexota bacterium]
MTVDELRAIDLHGDALGQYLYERARDLLQGGIPRDDLQTVLTSFYVWLGEQDRDEDQDAVADVLDSLVGFCSPSARL